MIVETALFDFQLLFRMAEWFLIQVTAFPILMWPSVTKFVGEWNWGTEMLYERFKEVYLAVNNCEHCLP